MFERYTEKARRVIFFARYEASQFGSPCIETEHLLLGLLREDKALANRFLRSSASVESIRKQIEAHTTLREKVSTSVDLPLSHECKRVLAYGAETLKPLVMDAVAEQRGVGIMTRARWQALSDQLVESKQLKPAQADIAGAFTNRFLRPEERDASRPQTKRE